MKGLGWLGILSISVLLVLGAAVVSNALAADQAKADSVKTHDFVGAKTCKMCHNAASKGAIYDAWEKTLHAQSYAHLPDANKKDPKCLVCHTTGYGKPGGFDPAVEATTTARLDAVGCEACHAPGKDYKSMTIMKDKDKAIAAGLIIPTAAVCKGCHEGAFPEGHKAVPKFDWATMQPKIAHPKPAATPQ